MTKSDSGQQRNNQPMNSGAAAAAADKTPLYGGCSLEEWWSHESQDGRLVSKKLGIGGQAHQSIVKQYVIGCGGTPNWKQFLRG
jgi:hypothetical protein